MDYYYFRLIFGLAQHTRTTENSAKLRLNMQNLQLNYGRSPKNTDRTKCSQLIPGKQ